MMDFHPLVITTSRGDRDLSDLTRAMITEGVQNCWLVFVPRRAGDVTGVPLSNLHVIPRGGYSTSRNDALRFAMNSDSTHLIFFDDDQLPVAGWLEAFRSYQKQNPQVEILIGPVLEVAVGGRSAAVAEDIRGSDSERSGMLERIGNSGNTCISTEWLRASRLLFDTELDEIGGEDTRFFTAALADGAHVHLVSAAKAIEAASVEKRSIRARWAAGRAMGRRRRALGPPYYRPVLTRFKAVALGCLDLLRGVVAFDRRLMAQGAYRMGIGYAK